MNIISNIRRFIGKQNFIKQVFAKLGGGEYSIHDRQNIICGAKYIDYFVTKDGAKYKVNILSQYFVEDTRIFYDWSDIQPDDIILDIGANIGGFAIGAAFKAKHVYAIEPIFYKELEENIKLNNLTNITILPFALNDGGLVNISCDEFKRDNIPSYTITGFKNIINEMSKDQHKITFIKSDCEGGEWYIKPQELIGVRRIEMEVHPKMFPTESYNKELIPYIKKNWLITYTNEHCELYMIHAHKKTS